MGDSVENLLDPVRVRRVADGVVHVVGSLPEHDTAELGIGGELCQQLLGLRKAEVVGVVVGGGLIGRQAEVELDVGVLGRRVFPARKRDIVATLAIEVVDTRTSTALRCVVELNPEEVERRLGHDGGEVSIRNDTLRRARDVVLLG